MGELSVAPDTHKRLAGYSVGGGKSDGFAAGRGLSELLIVPCANHLEVLDRVGLPPAILGYLARRGSIGALYD